jgi:hypothetical protein
MDLVVFLFISTLHDSLLVNLQCRMRLWDYLRDPRRSRATTPAFRTETSNSWICVVSLMHNQRRMLSLRERSCQCPCAHLPPHMFPSSCHSFIASLLASRSNYLTIFPPGTMVPMFSFLPKDQVWWFIWTRTLQVSIKLKRLAPYIVFSSPPYVHDMPHCWWICNVGCDGKILGKSGRDQGPQHHPSEENFPPRA